MTVFRSRVDFVPLLAVVVAVFLTDAAALSFSVPAIAELEAVAPFAIFLAVSFVPVLLVLAMFPVRYEVGADALLVRSGLLRWRIPMGDVHRASMVHGIRPAPALSTERVRIDYQKGARVRSMHISPVEPFQFLSLLASRDAGLVFDGREVVRRRGPILLFANVASRHGT